MIRQTVMVFISMLMAPDTKAAGLMTNNMVREKKPGQMAVNTMATMQSQRRKAEVPTHGLMAINTSETGERMPSMARVSISGLMAEFTADSG